jgi:hypothetical protein
LFIFENCSNSKIVQTKKLFKLENCSDFKFIQIRNCLENRKLEKTRQTSEPAEKKNRQEKKNKRTITALPGRSPYPPTGGAYENAPAGGA